ncbi:MAG: hypothetical protein KC933_18320 [Myxococcales bacterium]|nr:hypothetical protein [Myxococcales bacterium]
MALPTVAADLGVSHRWHHDPLVWLGVLVGVAAAGLVLFAGPYLPYPGWARDVALGAAFADGGAHGADAYLAPSLIPTPGVLFALATAAWTSVVTAEVGAKLNLLIAAGLLVIGAARLAEATGRSPRLALAGPVVLLGAGLGLDGAALVFTAPWLLFLLADLEWLLRAMRLDAPIYEREARLRSVLLSLWIALCFLGDRGLFTVAAALIVARLVVHGVRRVRGDRRGVARAVFSVGLTVVPTLLLAVPSLLTRAPAARPGARAHAPALADVGASLVAHGGALTAGLLAGTLALWLLSARGARHEDYDKLHTVGPWVYAVAAVGLAAIGLAPVGWPVLFLLLLPPAGYRGRRAALAAVVLLPVLHGAWLARSAVLEYSAWAAPYDRVRALIPPRQRVLPLSVPGAAGPWRAGEDLGFYHLVDGAAYVPLDRVPADLPMQAALHPAAPPGVAPEGYTPEGPASAYDYLVLRGPALVEATRAAPERFREVGEVEGWVVFQNRAPPPRAHAP